MCLRGWVGRCFRAVSDQFQTSFGHVTRLPHSLDLFCKAEKGGTYIITFQDIASSDHIGYDRIISDLQTLMPEGLTPPGTNPKLNPKLEKGSAQTWLERHPVKFQKVKK